MDVNVPVRMEMIGGPYDGHVWFPHMSFITTAWAEASPIVPEVDPTRPETASAPTSGAFASDTEVTITGPLGEAEYVWSDGDRWFHVDFWLFDPDDVGIDFDPDDGVDVMFEFDTV